MGFVLGSAAARAGYRLESFDAIGSTNDEALKRIRAGESGPIWLVTSSQTSGHGRRGRAWQGPPGNLAASLLLTTSVPVNIAATLGFVAGLSLSDALMRLDIGEASISLKWPNDVLVNGAKISGILLEGEPRDDDASAVVVGIGVNVVAAPQGVPYPAVCLAGLGATVTAEELFAVLSDCWIERCAQWNDGQGMESIRSTWLERASGIGGQVAVKSGPREVHGTFETLDADGRLVVRTDAGERVLVSAGDVHFGDAASMPRTN
ncbi:biotin--[acetyl-CoA-carboxylase] ligase [Microbaculum sp. FT89]|uniref:biotin--[acetyl-CoA-carboxylase] ligase n=1 Tax=Microbaculum sp. FT89 TaxID=3447298 RepID=UPI003F52CA08